MKSSLAPIGVSTYTRLEHLKKTVKALADNSLAEQSDVYFFSDGAKAGDESKVADVRTFLNTVVGFKSTTILARESNDRFFNNRGGIKQLLNEHGRMIFLEEDVVTHQDFLKFMNAGLTTYASRPDIFAICGYTPPIDIPASYTENVFICPRFSAWGAGLWKETYSSIIEDRSEYQELLNDSARLNVFQQNGEDMVGMLRRQAKGEIDGLDVQIFFTMFKNNQSVVCPTKSLTNNIGHDGTGLHCGVSTRFETDLDDRITEWVMDPKLAHNREINRRLYFFRSKLPQSTLLRNIKLYLYQPLVRPTYLQIRKLLRSSK